MWVCHLAPPFKRPCRSWAMELTNKEMQLLARLSRDRRLYAECKGADLDALQELGLLQWFDARSSTTPFKQDPRPLLRLHGIGRSLGCSCRKLARACGAKNLCEGGRGRRNRMHGNGPLLD